MGLALLACSGCAEELGPVPYRSARVSGLIKEGSIPVSGGWIEFLPVDGTVGRLRSAPIGRDGRFVVDGVGIGPNQIGLIGMPVRLRNGQRMFDSLGIPIRRRVGPSNEGSMTIDLVEEIVKSQATRTPP